MEFFAFILWIGFACGVGYLASERGRSGIGWGLLAALLSPLLMLIILLLLTDLKKELLANEERARQQYAQPNPAFGPAGASVAPASVRLASTLAPLAPELVATELERLSALVDKGRLTLDEYNEQKRRLLGQPTMPGSIGEAGGTPSSTQPEPARDAAAMRRAELLDTLATPERAVARLEAYGCQVKRSSGDVWEVVELSGITVFCRSREALQSLAVEYAMGERRGPEAPPAVTDRSDA